MPLTGINGVIWRNVKYVIVYADNVAITTSTTKKTENMYNVELETEAVGNIIEPVVTNGTMRSI